MRRLQLNSIDAASSFFQPMTNWIVPWNWFWQQKVPGKRGVVPRETMRYGGLVASTWHTRSQHSLYPGWSTPISSLLRSRHRLRDHSTHLSGESRWASQGMWLHMGRSRQAATKKREEMSIPRGARRTVLE